MMFFAGLCVGTILGYILCALLSANDRDDHSSEEVEGDGRTRG